MELTLNSQGIDDSSVSTSLSSGQEIVQLLDSSDKEVASAVSSLQAVKTGYVDIASFPERTPFSQIPPTTFLNVKHLLAQRNVTARYNVINKRTELRIPGLVTSVENADSASMTHVVSMFAALGMSTTRVPELVQAYADENLFNPAAEWIQSEEWDGRDRLPELYATLTVRADFPAELRDALMYHWLLSAVAAALSTTVFKTRGVLTLQGAQGMGKTAWIQALVSDPVLKRCLVRGEHALDTTDKDSVLTALSHWITEFGELESTFKRDIGKVKAFVTKESDRIRPPYGRVAHFYPRRTVFCASVNHDQFLVDPTGNTRWMTLPLVGINAEHGIDMQQVFAQLAVDFYRGAPWWLPKRIESRLETFNKQHAATSAIEERLRDAIDHDRLPTHNDSYMGTVEALKLVGVTSPTNPQMKEAAQVLRDLYGEPKRINGNMKWRVCWRRYFGQASSPGSDDLTDDDRY